jgi:hypothetical protein
MLDKETSKIDTSIKNNNETQYNWKTTLQTIHVNRGTKHAIAKLIISFNNEASA